MKMINLCKIFFISLALVLVSSGCSLFSPVKESQCIYELDRAPLYLPHKKKRPVNLLVMQPETAPAYDTTQMAYRTCPYQLGYFAKNRWAATPGQMLQQLLVQTLTATHHYHTVVTPPFLGQYDYILSSNILELRQDYTRCPPVTRFKLQVTLSKTCTNQILASQEFCIQEPFYCCTPYHGVIAANRAVEKALSQVAIFALRHS